MNKTYEKLTGLLVRIHSHCVIFSDCDCDLFLLIGVGYVEITVWIFHWVLYNSDKKNRSRNEKKTDSVNEA